MGRQGDRNQHDGTALTLVTEDSAQLMDVERLRDIDLGNELFAPSPQLIIIHAIAPLSCMLPAQSRHL
ncbi:hypothetical protein Q0Z83_075120 [Actinoplanes sichuanensis]|nr:hypothetical protein Q0Z83_075120 [Actinoplanes sichuanensis]